MGNTLSLSAVNEVSAPIISVSTQIRNTAGTIIAEVEYTFNANNYSATSDSGNTKWCSLHLGNDSVLNIDNGQFTTLIYAGTTYANAYLFEQAVSADVANYATSGGVGSTALVYRALLTQTGTNAPVATVLENTLGGTITWTREEVGVYKGTATAGTVTKLKCTMRKDNALRTMFPIDRHILDDNTEASGIVSSYNPSNDIIMVRTYASFEAPSDDYLEDYVISFEVYP